MRILQRILLLMVSVGLIAAGITLFVYPMDVLSDKVMAKLPPGPVVRYAIGCGLVALGVFTVLPFELMRRKTRHLAFPSAQGTVIIQLESFESALRKTIAKLPMIKRVHATVTPTDNDQKVRIQATVSLKKPEETSTRETSERLREFIERASRRILGADEVASVDLTITDVFVDPKQTVESLNSLFSDVDIAPASAPLTRAAAVAPVAAASAPLAEQYRAMYSEPENEPAPDLEPEQTLYNTHTQLGSEDSALAPTPHSDELLTYEEAQEYHKLQDPAAGESTEFARLADEDAEDDELVEAAPIGTPAADVIESAPDVDLDPEPTGFVDDEEDKSDKPVA